MFDLPALVVTVFKYCTHIITILCEERTRRTSVTGKLTRPGNAP